MEDSKELLGDHILGVSQIQNIRVCVLFMYFQGLSQSQHLLDVGWVDASLDGGKAGWMDARMGGRKEKEQESEEGR